MNRQQEAAFGSMHTATIAVAGRPPVAKPREQQLFWTVDHVGDQQRGCANGWGSRRYRAVEQHLISAPVFAALRAAGPLPVPVSDTAGPWLAEQRPLLAQSEAEVEQKAGANTLEDVLLAGGRLRISSLRVTTPYEAEGALASFYAHLPAIRITICSPTPMAGPVLPAALHTRLTAVSGSLHVD